jgi:Plasmid recombination enzyme/Toprim-like/Protein of unknown function (DUF3991)
MFAIMRSAKLKSYSDVVSCDNHNSRTSNVKNANPALTKNNRYLVGDENIAFAVRERIGDIKIRKNGVMAIEFIMTASPEYFRSTQENVYGDYDLKKVKDYEKAALKFLTKTFGKENIVSVVTHLDEATPHLHAIVTPIKDGKLNATHWCDGFYKMQKLQDDFAVEFESLGLKRGKKGSSATHEKVQSYYDDVNSAVAPDLITADVAKPPMLITDKAKKEWSEAESQRIQELQSPTLQPLANVAKELEREKEKSKQALEEVIRLKKKLETDRVRDIDLHQVMQICGYSKDPKDANQYLTTLGRISIESKGGKAKYYNHDQNAGGGGAIDLVKHLEQCNFQEAVAFLGANLNQSEVIASAQFKAKEDALEAVKQPSSIPDAVEANWHRVRQYLVDERKISPKVVDWLKEKGKIYADRFFNAIFVYTSGAVEVRGTSKIKFHGFRGKLAGGLYDLQKYGEKKMAIVEGAIDAISLRELRPDLSVVACGGKGNALKAASALKKRGYDVIIATDNDKSTDINYELAIAEYTRLKPGLKDWNDDLVEYRKRSDRQRSTQSTNEETEFKPT